MSSNLPPPRLRPARFEDYPQIHRLVTAHLKENQPEEDWLALWHNNPLWPRLGQSWPIGWVLESSAGEVVGSFSNVPSLYRFRGRELVCANGRDWVVAPPYRGFALWVIDEYFNQQGPDLFVNTTVKATAAPAVSTYSAHVPLGDWESTAYWVTGYGGFARRGLEKLGLPRSGALALPLAAGLWLKDRLLARRLPEPPPGVEIETGEGFDSRFDLFWEELVAQRPDRLLAVRDRKTLAWHFARPLRRGRLWVLTASRDGLLRAYALVKRQDLGEGLPRARLVDYQTVEPDADLLPGLLRAALRHCAAEGLCVLEHLGCDLPKMAALDRCAPYRRKLEAWPYYYHATDPALAAELMVPDVWDPSAYDGDASFE
jgi:hypothetical protein